MVNKYRINSKSIGVGIMWIIGTDEFNKNLDGWLFKNDQKNAKFFIKNAQKIPPMFKSYNDFLYRGMSVDAEFMNLLKDGKIVFANCTSWSKDIKIAKKFVNDPKYAISKKSGIKIIIKAKIPKTKQVLDIHSYVLFVGATALSAAGIDELSIDSAIKEQEVLIAPKLKIDPSWVQVIN